MELEIYLALTRGGVAEPEARWAAEGVRKGVEALVASAHRDLATKSDIARLDSEIGKVRIEVSDMRAELIQRISDGQRRTLGSIFGGVGLLIAVMTLLRFLH
ncbi:hypothetical protein [Roseateles chitosanitabidus]|uniref:hypothetical protein n=1 Tax=Roseateles chitosanitabidus TaxID=65048 RepID=UPI0008353A25|nr:hypothetical protein [Roseateles chitosanitabidus]